MRFYKTLVNNCIETIGTGNGGIEITEDEYLNIKQMIENKPVAQYGYEYILKSDLSWELVEQQPEQPIPEPTEAERLETLEAAFMEFVSEVLTNG